MNSDILSILAKEKGSIKTPYWSIMSSSHQKISLDDIKIKSNGFESEKDPKVWNDKYLDDQRFLKNSTAVRSK